MKLSRLRAELRGDRNGVLGEQMLHHPYVAVVDERHVYVRPRHEVDGTLPQPGSARRPTRSPLGTRASTLATPTGRPAAAGPRAHRRSSTATPRFDPRRRQLTELVGQGSTRRHQVDVRGVVLPAERRGSRSVCVTSPDGRRRSRTRTRRETTGCSAPGSSSRRRAREAHMRLAVHRAREAVRGRRRVVDAVLLTARRGRTIPLSTRSARADPGRRAARGRRGRSAR